MHSEILSMLGLTKTAMVARVPVILGGDNRQAVAAGFVVVIAVHGADTEVAWESMVWLVRGTPPSGRVFRHWLSFSLSLDGA